MTKKLLYEIEISIHASPQLIYQYISTPSGLSDWFADNVNYQGEFCTFIWDNIEENARICSKKTGERIKFRWLDENKKDTDYYFELKIIEDEITKDVSLLITDFAEENEIEASKKLWESQINELKHIVGSV